MKRRSPSLWEQKGERLSDKTISECAFTVKIPMYHGVDSLSVAAASAVAFYQLGNKQIPDECKERDGYER